MSKYSEIKNKVAKANKMLLEMDLVKWTSGNVSEKIQETDEVVIKPSGVDFNELNGQKMVITDENGEVIEGNLKPSVDLDSHLFIYKNIPEAKVVCHTHSPFATAFSIFAEEIPVLTTTHANVFGGPIPVSDYAEIGGEGIGKEIVKYKDVSKTVLIKNHGVFIYGETIEEVLKNAVVLEEIAEYAYYALLMDKNIKHIDQDEIKRSQDYYDKNYGQ